MKNLMRFNFEVDREKNLIRVERSFDAPVDLVWEAWTNPEILDQWWAPKPYRTETRSQEFRVDGQWLYCMAGPEGDRHWCQLNYTKIEPKTVFAGWDAFCDEHAHVQDTKPIVHWESRFSDQGQTTIVTIDLQFKSLEDLETILRMGFREGFTMGLENLDQYISARFFEQSRHPKSVEPRVSVYVNFPGTTEEAFRFYRGVFRTEFVNGITRFDQMPAAPGQPPLPESLKKMILHIELPLPGGVTLMATDAPAEMGFEVKQGNNMHINLEPTSREEADRLFAELSVGGQIEMPLQDMFWGAYFGSFRDRFGINWMINVRNQ